jgi:NCAIR mutase (PurE)-related protein
MITFDLNERRQDIIAVATELFEKFVNMPKDVRPDDKERTGIQVLVWEPGTRNLVIVSIKEPSEAAKFFSVEKAVRSHVLSDMSSQNSANPPTMEFAGSLSVFIDELPGDENGAGILRASTSGLTAEEEAAVSASVLARITGKSFVEICDSVRDFGGDLPDWYHKEDKGYFQFLFE